MCITPLLLCGVQATGATQGRGLVFGARVWYYYQTQQPNHSHVIITILAG
jgi:hypothetical protein